MTDNEIIKALEYCSDDRDCGDCQYDKIDDCIDTVMKEALDLINRQKAEIEKLKIDNECLAVQIKDAYEQIHRLSVQNFGLSIAKTEAIKEFAERLTNKIFSCDVIGDRDNIGYIASDIHSIIDNLVEEMTEQSNG